MRIQNMFMCAAALSLLSAGANAQSRGEGWEFGADLLYQNSNDVEFDGGTTVAFDSDIGFSLCGGYRFSERLEVQFGLDWTNVDYDVSLQLDPGWRPIDVSGEIEAFTPFIKGNFNFIDGPFTPYVSGWNRLELHRHEHPRRSAADRLLVGSVVRLYLHDRSGHAHHRRIHLQRGLGVRWDLSTGYSLRLAYEKQWYDLDNASPDFDVFRLGFVMRY